MPPSTPTLRSPNTSPHPGVFGWLFRLSEPDMAALDHENALKGLTKLYQPVIICPPPSSSSSSSSVPMQAPIYAKFYCDLKNTCDGMMDIREDPRVGRLWMMDVYRPFRSGCAGGYLRRVQRRLRGEAVGDKAWGKGLGKEEVGLRMLGEMLLGQREDVENQHQVQGQKRLQQAQQLLIPSQQLSSSEDIARRVVEMQKLKVKNEDQAKQTPNKKPKAAEPVGRRRPRKVLGAESGLKKATAKAGNNLQHPAPLQELSR
ncbi:hypothetical protein ACMFMF_005718 [Clarireedia jacksonii]